MSFMTPEFPKIDPFSLKLIFFSLRYGKKGEVFISFLTRSLKI